MTIRPLNDRILVKPSVAADKTEGGIIIPETAKEKPTRGEVLAVGSGKLLGNGERAPMDVKPGAVVWYGKYAGIEVEVDGAKLRVIGVDDVLGVEE